jgi:Fe/S biogenesis protein NfuA
MLTFTDAARDMLLAYMNQDDDGGLALRVTQRPGSPLNPHFELTLVSESDRAETDLAVDGGGFTVLVAEDDKEALEGATVDFVQRVNESGFEVRPVNQKTALSESGGELADRVRSVLETQINPAVASHGGAILLADVKGSEIFIEMAGGCQGCAMSRMTLRQGVERMLAQAIPEVTAVHDVTDHASGENPFFTH